MQGCHVTLHKKQIYHFSCCEVVDKDLEPWALVCVQGGKGERGSPPDGTLKKIIWGYIFLILVHLLCEVVVGGAFGF